MPGHCVYTKKESVITMAKMTDEEFNKALDTIIDSVTEAMLENVMKANEQMGKILLKNYEQVKKLIRHIEK